MNTKSILKFLFSNTVVVIIVLLVVIMSFTTKTFLTVQNFSNILSQIAIYGVVAFAMTIAVICGEFDLSVGSLMAVVTILFTDFSKRFGVPVAIVGCLALGVLVGLINGFMVSKIKMSAFVATLSTMVALKGLALTYTSGKPINYVNDDIYDFGNGSFLKIPIIVWFFLAALIITYYVLKHTKFGRGIYATGGNMTVAKMAGLNVDFYKTVIFVILGVATAIAGMLLSARLSAGNSLYGSDLSMTVVAGVVIGGTSLSGGKGSAMKTLWGMLIIGILFNALLILGVQANWQDVIKGLILIIVVSVDATLGKKKY